MSFFSRPLFSCTFLHFSSIHATWQNRLLTVLFTVYSSLLLLSSSMAFTLFTFNCIIIIFSTVPHSIILSLNVVPIQINQYVLRMSVRNARACYTHYLCAFFAPDTFVFLCRFYFFSPNRFLSLSVFLDAFFPRSRDLLILSLKFICAFFCLQHDYFCDDDHISLAFMSLML